MGKAGSTRGHGDSHRGRERRRSSNNQAFPDSATSTFQSQCILAVGSSRRRRGYQPDEVNKKTEISEFEATEGGGITENPTVVDIHHEPSNTDNKPASIVTSLAPHQRNRIKGKENNHLSFTRTQVVTMDASHPELDLVHFDGVSEPVESESSSFKITTERRPSCWSIASPPEAVPTEWNSAAANIDRPAPTKLPIYRIPKPEHKTKHDLTSNSFNRQQMKIRGQKIELTPNTQESCEMTESARTATSANDNAQAPARITPLKDGHAADLLHQKFQQLHYKAQLDAKQASQMKLTPKDVLSRTVQASSDVQLEGDNLKTSSTTQDTPQAKLFDANKTSIASSALPSQPETNQGSTITGTKNGVVPPHLRMHTGPRQDRKTKPLLPHLGNSASPSTTAVTKTTTHREDPEGGKHKSSAMQVNKLPPHLQVLSTIKPRATKGPLSLNTPLPISQQKDPSYQPTIDIDEEIAATQPILDIDEEIVAGLRAEETDANAVTQPANVNVQEIDEQIVYVPPHTEAPFPRSKATADQVMKPQVDQHNIRNHSTNTQSDSLTVRTHAGTNQDFTSTREIVKLASTSKNGTIPNGAESSVKRGKKPAREFGSVDFSSELVGWDGKMKQPPVGEDWNRRPPFDPRCHERLSVVEAWREEHAADPEESNRVVVNTASADFQTGEGLAGGDVNVLSPIDKKDHETHVPNDDFTQARRHQNAAEAIKDYKAKIAAKPKVIHSGIEGMTKEEKRSLRRALIEEERARETLPNPHAPAANIYIRPAEFKDMGQVMKIDNHYIRTTTFVLDLDAVDELYWRSRLQEAENEKNPFIVAIHMGEKSCRHQEDIIRKKQENIVGFAVAADLGNKTTMYHSSVELELMVHPHFLHQGIGQTLLDRILGALSPDHNVLECAPFLPHNDISHWIRGGSRQAKAIIVNIHYPDSEEDTVSWRKQWLAKYDFQHVGTLPQVGFRKGKLVNTCQLVLNTRARL